MRISIKLNKEHDMDYKSSYNSKTSFANSHLWDLIKHGGVSGVLKVTYQPDYTNEGEFTDWDSFKALYDVFTEDKLVNEFTESKTR